MKFNLLQKQTSRREMLRGSATLAGSAFLAHFLPTTLLHASAPVYGQQTPSPADLRASMRAKFNAAPLETQRLAEDVVMFSGPGGSVVVLNGPDGKLVVDTLTDNFSATITTAAWRTKPSWMVVAGSDRTINPDLERWYAKRGDSRTVGIARQLLSLRFASQGSRRRN